MRGLAFTIRMVVTGIIVAFLSWLLFRAGYAIWAWVVIVVAGASFTALIGAILIALRKGSSNQK